MVFALLAIVTAVQLPVQITRNVTLKPGRVFSPSKGRPALTVRGDGITVDFGGLEIYGSDPKTRPDLRTGTGIEVQGRNITLKNVRVHGYKVGLIARDCPGLRILGGDLSYNWKQHLASTPEQEDESDWMSYHQNEKDEWLQYGAGIYLRGCQRPEIKGVRITGGQCGLMMTQCDDGLVWNNDFSFLSGIGIGLYRSSRNRVQNNRIDWCVRGYSHGVYNRGQDSAGILVYEQSNGNTFAYNSVTHGGDGFFLWAGQTTMDTGKGGCNDNLVYGNDFSHAPTNGIEATFSRNTFANNLVLECWHGLWGGYSYDTQIVGNVFGYNTDGIAIEHGQDIAIRDNVFFRDNTAIRLWQNATQDSNWGYPKGHDTASRDTTIIGNSFIHLTDLALDFHDSKGVRFDTNRFGPVKGVLRAKGVNRDFHFAGATIRDRKSLQRINPVEFSPGSTGGEIFYGGLGEVLPNPNGKGALADTPESMAEYRSRFIVSHEVLTSRSVSLVNIGSMPQGQDLAGTSYRALSLAPAKLPGAMDAFLPLHALRGRRFIVVDEWGPYDFRRPLLHAVPGQKVPTAFEIWGPKGRWRVVQAEGVTVSAKTGTVPGNLKLIFDPKHSGRTSIELEYIGEATTDYRGIVTPAGKPVRFGWSQFRIPMQWDVAFYPWDAKTDPRIKPYYAYKQNPLVGGTTVEELNFAGYGGFAKGVPKTNFASVANTEVTVPKGKFTLEATTDDGIRVWVDDVLVIDSWKYQGPTVYTAPIKPGHHTIHVEHFQIDGYSALKVKIRP